MRRPPRGPASFHTQRCVLQRTANTGTFNPRHSTYARRLTCLNPSGHFCLDPSIIATRIRDVVREVLRAE
ncbi:MAG: hypothetical protein WD801_03595 [Gemmatimonadaceae bacterium]